MCTFLSLVGCRIGKIPRILPFSPTMTLYAKTSVLCIIAELSLILCILNNGHEKILSRWASHIYNVNHPIHQMAREIWRMVLEFTEADFTEISLANKHRQSHNFTNGWPISLSPIATDPSLFILQVRKMRTHCVSHIRNYLHSADTASSIRLYATFETYTQTEEADFLP